MAERWEYKLLHVRAASNGPGDVNSVPFIEKHLNELGAQGWRVRTMSFPTPDLKYGAPQGKGYILLERQT